MLDSKVLDRDIFEPTDNNGKYWHYYFSKSDTTFCGIRVSSISDPKTTRGEGDKTCPECKYKRESIEGRKRNE